MNVEKYINFENNSYRVKIKQGDFRLTKQFNVDKFGGKEKALELALKFRNKILKERGMLQFLNRERTPNLVRNNRNDQPIIGIYKTHRTKHGVTAYSWTSRASDRSEPTKRSFSIKKYGNESSFIYACIWRYKKCGTLIVINKDTMPCLPTVPYMIMGEKND